MQDGPSFIWVVNGAIIDVPDANFRNSNNNQRYGNNKTRKSSKFHFP